MDSGYFHKIMAVYPSARPGEDFKLESNGRGGHFLALWNDEKLGPPPDLSGLPEPDPAYYEAQKEAAARALIETPLVQALAGALAEKMEEKGTVIVPADLPDVTEKAVAKLKGMLR